jgi:hypothetical protein
MPRPVDPILGSHPFALLPPGHIHPTFFLYSNIISQVENMFFQVSTRLLAPAHD